MRKKGKVNISFITNERKRKTTFMKRRRGMLNKIHELTTLCGVQACAVIYSPTQSVPEAWPSREGVKEVASKFMGMPEIARTKHMMDQETYFRGRIAKGMEKVQKLSLENRESHVRQFMFDCLEGKMSEYRYDARDLHDLKIYIQHYIDQLTRRMESLTENSESSSSFHIFHDAVTYAYPRVVVDPTIVTNVPPTGFCNHIQYQNINQNQEGSVQYQVPTNAFDIIQYQNMNMNQNQQKPLQYETPTDFYDNIQHGLYNMNLNEDMNLDSNHNLNMNLNLNSNQYPNQQEPFMNLMMEQHMGYGGGYGSIPFMDVNNYNYHHLPTNDLVTTNQMPSITTTTGGGHASIPFMDSNNYNYYHLPTDDLATINHMPSITTTTGGTHANIPFMVCNNYNYYHLPTDDLATINHMPSITTTTTGGGHASIPFMDGNNYNYHHLPTNDLASTNHMSSITSTTGVYAPINNDI